MGKILRIDLTSGSIQEEALDPDMAEKYLGGSGFGVEYLYREVPPGVEWDDPGNRIIMASGPVGGVPLAGAGTFSLVTKGPMTNLRSRRRPMVLGACSSSRASMRWSSRDSPHDGLSPHRRGEGGVT